ncbi:hypothetical protein [Nostoc sp.]|uniref:hypothetical protein n=1 Tax=Nostoc sp. TaxID=1180 RepID=UPI003FA57FAC
MQRIRLKQVINYRWFQNVFADDSTNVPVKGCRNYHHHLEILAFYDEDVTSHIKRFGDYLIDMETVPNLLDDGLLILV